MTSTKITSPLRLRSDLHLARKLWHMSTGLLGLFCFYKFKANIDDVATGLLIFALCAFAFELLRLKNEKVNQLLMIVMKPIMRESERNSVSGLPYYALGVSLSLFFFPEKIAIISILFLIFADPIASFCGILFGRDKILPNKSLQGTIAAFSVCYIITLLCGVLYHGPSFSLVIFSIFAGVVGCISEMCSQFIDDNLCIPVLSGLGLTLINVFIPFFN